MTTIRRIWISGGTIAIVAIALMVAVVVALFLGGGSVAPCLAGYTAPEAQAACAQAYAERLGPWERFAYDNPTGATLAIGLIAFLFVLAGGFALRRAATR